MSWRRPTSDTRKGCMMIFGVALVALTGIFMFLFVALPLRALVGLRRLLGRAR